MIPEHRKPKWGFTPAAPQKRTPPQEEGVPLHQIDRRLWPGIVTVWHDGPDKPQAQWAAEAAGQTDEIEIESVPAAGVARLEIPTEDANLCVSASLRENPDPNLAGIPSASSDVNAVESGRTDRDVYPTLRNHGGRPRAITPQKRTQLLHILRRGQSRRLAAERMGIDAATITRAIRRDPRLAVEVMEAENEG